MLRSSVPFRMDLTHAHIDSFRSALLRWFDAHQRALPWRHVADPYAIWVSEVMLQQTRTDQAAPYYTRFLEAFPTVFALAAADLDAILRCWEGLGYYARARHLHQAAQAIVRDHGGRLPASYEALRALPGVGPYTAGAIASIAFGLPHPAIDGNARRVLTRYFALHEATDRHLRRLASRHLPHARPGDFNQALMELGAVICTPAAPACGKCPVHEGCKAHAEGNPERYPTRKARKKVPHYDVAAGAVFDSAGRLLIQRRPREALLGGLWELPGGKRRQGESLRETCQREVQEELGIVVSVNELIDRVRHAYSHFRITLYAFRCHVVAGTPVSAQQLPVRWVALSDLADYAFPRANRRILDALVQAPGNITPRKP